MKTEGENKIMMNDQVRAVCASLSIRHPNLTDRFHRDSLLHFMAGNLDQLNDGQIVRMFESAALVEVPGPDVEEFRKALQCAQGRRWGLRKFRSARPAQPNPPKQ